MYQSTPYTEEHERFRAVARRFCEAELLPHTDAWEEDELFPRWVIKRAGELGILGGHLPEEVGRPRSYRAAAPAAWR